MNPSAIEIIAAGLFGIAVLHTFSTKFFEHLARLQPAHAGLFHLLGEVEVVFGFWAMVMMVCMFAIEGREAAVGYLNSCNFTEPMFVFVIMVIAGTRPVLYCAGTCLQAIARLLPLPSAVAFYFVTLCLVPLLGSLITEPAAMTLAALMLYDRFFSAGVTESFKYATIGVLFVNISIGGVLTPFAAPPVLMVAGTWSWDTAFMLLHFGWKAGLAVAVNAMCASLLFRKQLRQVPPLNPAAETAGVPGTLIAVHLAFLAGVVYFAHDRVIFMSLFLFFLGVARAYSAYQDRLILREGLLVAFFLAGLVVLGGHQRWWLQPLLMSMGSDTVFFGTTALTAITDNAALTYLGSLVTGLSDDFKYALVAGAVTGGGLTIIANAPNPAGVAILRDRFQDETVQPVRLFAAALLPTAIGALAFWLL